MKYFHRICIFSRYLEGFEKHNGLNLPALTLCQQNDFKFFNRDEYMYSSDDWACSGYQSTASTTKDATGRCYKPMPDPPKFITHEFNAATESMFS